MLAVDPRMDALRGCADAAKACVSWAIMSQLTIRTRRWTGGRLEDGTAIDSDLVLKKAYPIRQLNGREVAASGGLYSTGDIIVEDITPAYTSHGGGGYGALDLDPSPTLAKPNRDTEILYLIDGDFTGIYALLNLDTASDPTAWTLVLRQTRKSP